MYKSLRKFSVRQFHTSKRLFEQEITPMEPVCAQKTPYCIQLEANKQYSWCSCGLSEKQPICDGKHKGKGIKPVRFTVETEGEKWLCGCKKTKNPPYCDGAHSQL